MQLKSFRSIMVFLLSLASNKSFTMEQTYHYHSDPRIEFIYAAYFGNMQVLIKAHAQGVPIDVLPFFLGDTHSIFASQTALFHAILRTENHLPMVKYLLDHGADPNIANSGGVTPLMVASHAYRDDDVEKVRMLLAKGAAVNELDNAGHTALYRAQETLNHPNNTEEYRRDYKQRAAIIIAMLREKGAVEINKEKII